MGCLRYAPAAEPPNRRQEPSWAARGIRWQLSHQTGAAEPPNRRSGAVAQLQEVAREAVAQTACDVSMLTSRWFAQAAHKAHVWKQGLRPCTVRCPEAPGLGDGALSPAHLCGPSARLRRLRVQIPNVWSQVQRMVDMLFCSTWLTCTSTRHGD
jgi:hypothetical protein